MADGDTRSDLPRRVRGFLQNTGTTRLVGPLPANTKLRSSKYLNNLSWRRMTGSTALTHSKGPRVLTAMTLSHSSEAISVNGFRAILPNRAALLTSTVRRQGF